MIHQDLAFAASIQDVYPLHKKIHLYCNVLVLGEGICEKYYQMLSPGLVTAGKIDIFLMCVLNDVSNKMSVLVCVSVLHTALLICVY